MTVTMVVQGVLRPDGLIELLDPVDLPLERRPVMVTVTDREESASVSSASGSVTPTPGHVTGPLQREPGGFWLDESISAPFDLPRSGTPRPVKVSCATKPRLPDPVFILIEDGQ